MTDNSGGFVRSRSSAAIVDVLRASLNPTLELMAWRNFTLKNDVEMWRCDIVHGCIRRSAEVGRWSMMMQKGAGSDKEEFKLNVTPHVIRTPQNVCEHVPAQAISVQLDTAWRLSPNIPP